MFAILQFMFSSIGTFFLWFRFADAVKLMVFWKRVQNAKQFIFILIKNKLCLHLKLIQFAWSNISCIMCHLNVAGCCFLIYTFSCSFISFFYSINYRNSYNIIYWLFFFFLVNIFYLLFLANLRYFSWNFCFVVY